MIKAEKTVVELEGKQSEILTEYALLTSGMREAITDKCGNEDYAEFAIFKAMKEGLDLVDTNTKRVEESDPIMEAVDRIIEEIKKGDKDGRK